MIPYYIIQNHAISKSDVLLGMNHILKYIFTTYNCIDRDWSTDDANAHVALVTISPES